MAPFDTFYYWSSILSRPIALACTIFGIFDVRDLEVWVKGHYRSLKMVPLESLCMVSYSSSVATMAASSAVYEIFSEEEEVCLPM